MSEIMMARRLPRHRSNLTPKVDILADVVYGQGGNRPLTMHLLLPRHAEASRPGLVWVHGGAWRAGNKDGGIARLLPFARRGYVGASVEYRLSQEARFPAQIQDCKCAIRFLRAHSNELGLDPNRIGAWGSSAGGHLVSLLGAAGDAKDLEGDGGWSECSSRVQAVCDWYGPSDLLRMDDVPSEIAHNASGSPESQLIGGPIQMYQNLAGRASPISYVTPDAPPFLIMHGDQDPLVPVNQSIIFTDALRRAGVEVTLKLLPGAGHGGSMFETTEALQLVEEFFRQHL